MAGFLGKVLGDLISPIKDIVSEVVVDKDKARELNVRLQELADKADERIHEQTLAQIEVNKEEAKHDSIFVAGWRPAVGWTGAAGFGYMTIIEPVARFIATMFGYEGAFPQLDDTLLITVLGGILGLGGLRTYEKYKGVERKSL